MNKVQSILEIQEMVRLIKMNRKGVITNFFIDSFKHSLWINQDELYSIRFDSCFLLLRKNQSFLSLYYIAIDIPSLESAIRNYCESSKDIFLIDIIGLESDICSIKDMLCSTGFEIYEKLYRMSRVGSPSFCLPIEENVTIASELDSVIVKKILDDNFNSYSEQIPKLEEINQFASNGGVLVYKEDNVIYGFVIYELFGATLHWRYWFVCQEYRDKKIGSKLFNSVMQRSYATKRQILWVVESNENAIKRHEYYGFVRERLNDYILIKKKMENKIVAILNNLRPEFDFNEPVNFIEEGMIDSLDVVNLVAELESTFNINIDGLDVVPENFSTIENIMNLLSKNSVK